MVNVLILCLELMLDVVGIVTGIIVLKRSADNRLQRSWGTLTVSLSSLLFFDNVFWIYLFNQGVEVMPRFTELPMNHLSLWHVVRVIVFFQFFSLFPIASLKPGWMKLSRVINLSIPIILIVCIACCYQFFNGHFTELNSFKDIWLNIGKQDVMVRFVLFVVSVITPSINFLFPYLKKWIPIRRKQSRAMTIYMVCFGMIMSGYIWLMLGTSGFCFNLFGYLVIVPCVYLNVLYILEANPLALPPLPVEDMKTEEFEAIQEIEVSPVVLELATRLQVYMKESKVFTNSQYALQDLLADMDTNENRLNKALHYDGFSGFRDYINYLRLQYFKEQAALQKKLTVKELMFMSGFTSRSSFYRLFASIEKMSPSEYLDKLNSADSANDDSSQS